MNMNKGSRICMDHSRPFGVMFHHFHKKGDKPLGQGSLTPERFANIITQLKDEYNLLPAKSWYYKAATETLEKDDICITFDDNLLSQYEIAFPILEKHNLTGFWFVYSSPLKGELEKLELYRYYRCTEFNDINEFYKGFDNKVSELFGKDDISRKLLNFDSDNYLSAFPFYSLEDKRFRYLRDEILGELNYNHVMDMMIENSRLKLSDVSKKIWFNSSAIKHLHQSGHIIGLHSHSHPNRLNQLSHEDQYREYIDNYKILNGITEERLSVAAHPTNSYNDDTFKVFKELNVIIGFRSTMEIGFDSNYEFPRIDHALLSIT
jgi:peptidoglycan/xylan/chitin deacetylase (PgdA/CDA1 family)